MAKIENTLPPITTGSGGISRHNDLLGLNDGDYIHLTSLEKDKFDNLPDVFAPVNAEQNVNTDWNSTSGDSQLLNKPSTFPPSTHTHVEADIIDLDKYTQSEVSALLDDKVDKVAGKNLSEENYTSTEKSKLAGIESNAEVNNISDINATNLTNGSNTTLHNHDSRYYTESEINALLALKEDSVNLDPLIKRKYFDDLIGFGVGNTSSIFLGTGTLESEGNVSVTKIGTGTVWTRTNAEPGRGGIIRGGTGTTATGLCQTQFRSIWLGEEDFIAQTSMRVQTLSTSLQRFNYIFVVGLGLSNAMRIIYSDNVNGGNFSCQTYSGGLSTIIDSGIPVIFNNWYDFKIIRISMVCYFYINNTLVATSSTNIPSNLEVNCTSLLEKTVGTTSRTCDFDYLKFFDL